MAAGERGELDNRGSHFYLALYWAEELAKQTDDGELAAAFGPLAEQLAANEATIVEELTAVQGSPSRSAATTSPTRSSAAAAMRPSKLFNAALATIG